MTELIPVLAVPARNEEEQLPSFFASLAAQSWHAGRTGPLHVVVVLNNCTDGSRKAVERAAATYPMLAIRLFDVELPAAQAHVGTARRMAMEAAFRVAPPERLAILTTDADSTPLPDWVTANLRHLADGIDLVCGQAWLNKDEYDRLDTKLNARSKLGYDYTEAVDRLTALLNPSPHDPWPRHSDHTGQSLAIRGDTYLLVGGLPPLPSKEDLALVRRVLDYGYRIRHPLDVAVETSARLVGRAAGGMAEALRDRLRDATAELPLMVEHPVLTLRRLTGTAPARSDDPLPVPARTALIALHRMIAEFSETGGAALTADPPEWLQAG